MTCTALSYAERDIVGRGLSITTMVVTFLCIRYTAIWRFWAIWALLATWTVREEPAGCGAGCDAGYASGGRFAGVAAGSSRRRVAGLPWSAWPTAAGWPPPAWFTDGLVGTGVVTVRVPAGQQAGGRVRRAWQCGQDALHVYSCIYTRYTYIHDTAVVRIVQRYSRSTRYMYMVWLVWQ